MLNHELRQLKAATTVYTNIYYFSTMNYEQELLVTDFLLPLMLPKTRTFFLNPAGRLRTVKNQNMSGEIRTDGNPT